MFLPVFLHKSEEFRLGFFTAGKRFLGEAEQKKRATHLYAEVTIILSLHPVKLVSYRQETSTQQVVLCAHV